MLKRTQTFPIGIDISNTHIHAAQFRGSRQDLNIRRLYQVPVEEAPDDTDTNGTALAAALKRLARQGRFRGKKAVVRIPAQHIYRFPIQFEVGDGQSVEGAMVDECRRYLSFPVAEGVIDYVSIKETAPGKTRQFKANIIAVRRRLIDQYTDVFKRAGFAVCAIDCGLTALTRLHLKLHGDPEKPIILCHIGRRRSLIAVVSHDHVLGHRNASWGINALGERLETNLGISGDGRHAGGLLATYGLYYDHWTSGNGESASSEEQDPRRGEIDIYRNVFQIITPYVDEFIYELFQIVGYVRGENQGIQLGEVMLYGRAGHVNHLDAYITHRLNIPARCVNPLTDFAPPKGWRVSNPRQGASFAPALGLALRKVT